MVDINGVSNLGTIAGDYLTSVHVHTMAMTADEYNTTEAYQSFQNASTNDEATDNEMTTDEYSALLSALLIFTWILSPFVLTGNGLTIAVVMKYIKTVTPTHVGIVFLSFTGLFVGIIPLLNLTIYLMGDSVNAKYIHNSTVWVSLVARGLNICAILLIAFERCFLVTSWKLYKKHLSETNWLEHSFLRLLCPFGYCSHFGDRFRAHIGYCSHFGDRFRAQIWSYGDKV